MFSARALVRERNLIRSSIIVLTTLAVAFTGPWTSSLAGPERARGNYRFKSAEVCFMRKINQARKRHGLRTLRWDMQLGYVARRHARQMAGYNSVYHDPNVGQEVTRWRTIAQNTGRGRNCKRTFKSFMASAPHRANVLGRWRFLGVGIEHHGGYVYVQQLYEKNNNPGNIYHWP